MRFRRRFSITAHDSGAATDGARRRRGALRGADLSDLYPASSGAAAAAVAVAVAVAVAAVTMAVAGATQWPWQW